MAAEVPDAGGERWDMSIDRDESEQEQKENSDSKGERTEIEVEGEKEAAGTEKSGSGDKGGGVKGDSADQPAAASAVLPEEPGASDEAKNGPETSKADESVEAA